MIWKDIKGYKGIYQINSRGQIKSLTRKVKNGAKSYMIRKGRILKPALCGGTNPNDRYEFYHLRNRNGVGKNYYRHVLIGIYFIPNPHRLSQINHKNGKKRDNRSKNLQWVSPSQNIQHAVGMRLIHCGEDNYNARLTDEKILMIRKDKRSNSAIAKDYGVCHQLISNIKRRKTWKHV